MNDRQTQRSAPARTARVHGPDAALDYDERSALDRFWVRRTTACPVCGAELDKRCKGRRGDRERNHLERVRAAIRRG